MGSEPKNKDTDKVRFFKVDTEGGVTPESNTRKKEDSFSPISPNYDLDSPMQPMSEATATEHDSKAPKTSLTSSQVGAPMNEPSYLSQAQKPEDPPRRRETTMTGIEPRLEGDAPNLEVQLDLLKPQIDSIQRMADELKAGPITDNQVETLRKYISLKEAEVRDLRDQQLQYQTFVKKLSSQVEGLTRQNRDALVEAETARRREEAARAEYKELKDRYSGDLAAQKVEYEDRLRRSGNYDAQAEELYRKKEEWKEKVREELKRIKLKEKELETKHELLRRDMQALLDSKDKHVMELKKKSDALEIEMESLEDRLRRSNFVLSAIESKKKRLIETMRLAISLLEEIDNVDPTLMEKDRKAG